MTNQNFFISAKIAREKYHHQKNRHVTTILTIYLFLISKFRPKSCLLLSRYVRFTG